MSNAQARFDLASAVGTVEGIKGYARRPRAPKAGDAWPQWGGAERVDGLEFVQTWRIMVVLDQGTAENADAAADRWGDAIADALTPYLFVSAMAPATLAAEGTELYALMITGRSE